MQKNIAVVVLGKSGPLGVCFRETLRKCGYVAIWELDTPEAVRQLAGWFGWDDIDLVVKEEQEAAFWKREFPNARTINELG